MIADKVLTIGLPDRLIGLRCPHAHIRTDSMRLIFLTIPCNESNGFTVICAPVLLAGGLMRPRPVPGGSGRGLSAAARLLFVPKTMALLSTPSSHNGPLA